MTGGPGHPAGRVADGAAAAAEHFRTCYARDPAAVFSAPGRVNLIGEHTDYNAGLVLPFAVDARAFVAVGRGDGGQSRVSSAQRADGIQAATTEDLTGDLTGDRMPGRSWAAYPFGVLWALGQAGLALGPVDLALHSTVPVGAGLSSSAAVECAVALAVSTLYGVGIDREQLARIAQRAENEYVGVPCGLMDQMASASCRAGHALFFDVGADTTEQIPFDPAADGLVVLVIDTQARHALADGEYAQRRADCERAARLLDVAALSQIAPVDLETALARLDEKVLRRRVRHVVSENERVRRVVALLRAGRLAAIGDDLSASHASLRDDFEVSSRELDVAVDAALAAGALGARMTGGGFGGSAIALVPGTSGAIVAESVREAFARNGFPSPEISEVLPAEGARREV